MKNNAEKVTKYLIEKNLKITFMESCTSGLLASMFTDTEGASKVFFGSFVTYANDAKVKAGVDKNVIDTYGVYSAECAAAMAKAAKDAFGADISVGITGTTGNIDPNNSDSVSGEAFYAILINDKSYNYHISRDVSGMSRAEIKKLYADEVYEKLVEHIKD